MRHRVGRANGGAAGVPIIELPGEQLPVRGHTGLHGNQTGWTQVSEREFLGARPHQLDGATDGTSQSGRLDGVLAGVLAAICRPGVGDDHTDAAFGKMKRLGELG